ncbi:MAG TPA: hypothetical protein VFA85_00980 [Terriglobales bacterium]|nr:hypothetical protein [Terriglobales bacterium]
MHASVPKLLYQGSAVGKGEMGLAESSSDKGKRKLTALPLLVVLFAISYGMLIKLVLMQDKTIDSQRSLIHLLFADNISLSKLHRHAATLPKHSSSQNDIAVEFGSSASGRSAAKAPSTQGGSNQAQSNQVQSTPVQTDQVQSSRPGPHANGKTDRKARKTQKPLPPPAELTDPSDQRRVNFSI